MKYAIILYDGMADLPIAELGGKTPMEAAKKPNFDRMGALGEVGLVKTVADGLKPGSDVANLSVMGYDPAVYYTGRAPLEAESLGVNLTEDDIVLRCNLVTLSEDEPYENKRMIDYSAGDIANEEAAEIIKSVAERFGSKYFSFYAGVSYRHCLVWHGGTPELARLTPPHDISGKVIAGHLSTHENAKELIDIMRKSFDFLKNHPVNSERMRRGKKPANSLWFWGEGKKTTLPPFEGMFNLKGSVVSAVDLLRGIGKCAKMNTPEVEGATGYIDTNFEGKAHAAMQELAGGQDFVYLHIEAPDECGHRRELENKVRSIELIDERVLPIVINEMEKYDDYKIMILPDHPTPISSATHSADPVPYMIYHKKCERMSGVQSVTEKTAASTGIFIEHGPDLIKRFFNI